MAAAGQRSSCACARRPGLPPSAGQGLQGKMSGAAEAVTAAGAAGAGPGHPGPTERSTDLVL